MIGSPITLSQTLLPIGRENTKGCVLKSTIQKTANDLLSLFTLIRINTDTNKITGRDNDLFFTELTVLRPCVARSKDSGYTTTLGSSCHKENRPI